MKRTKRIVAFLLSLCLMVGVYQGTVVLAQDNNTDAALTITKVEDIGNHSFKVHFSEPIAAMSSYPQMGIRVVKRGTNEVPGRKDAASTLAEWVMVSTSSVSADGLSLTYTRSLSNPTLIGRGINELAYRGSGYVLEFVIQDFGTDNKTNDRIDSIVAKADASKKLLATADNGSGVERAACEITLAVPYVTSAQQINATKFLVTFSEPVRVNGSPNMGFRIVRKADMSVATRTDNGGVAQWIGTGRYVLASDGLSLIYTAPAAELQAMRSQEQALGSSQYVAKFVIVESGGNDDVYAGGGTAGVTSADGTRKLAAGFFRTGSNGFATAPVLEWRMPTANIVYRMNDKEFRLIFDEPTALAPDEGTGGARVGLFVIDKTTMKLADFGGSYRQYFSRNYTWNAEQTVLTWTAGDGIWAEATAAAATNDKYEVVFGVLDPVSGLDGAMNNMTVAATGEYYVGNAVGSASDRLYVSIEEPSMPTIVSVQQIEGESKFHVTFSEAVDITGSPNIGFAVVDGDEKLANASEQYISTDMSRVAWAEDHRSFVWTADATWYSSAAAKAQARGAGYQVRFVIVDGTGTLENRKIDQVIGRAFGTALAATFSTGSASERCYADITPWVPVSITEVKQLDRGTFRVTFSEPVDIAGTPNIGLAVVNQSYVLGSPSEQHIFTDMTRVTWANDHRSFVWRAEVGQYATALSQAAARGEGYSVQFVIIENNANQSNQTVDNVVSKATGNAAKATTYAAGVNARIYHEILPAEPPHITSVQMLDDDTYQITFDQAVQLLGTPNIGIAVVKKSDYTLANVNEQHISKDTARITWSADATVMTWKGMDNIYKTALSQAAARGENYTVRFFFGEDGTRDTSNYSMDHIVSVSSGDAIDATTYANGSNARVYAEITPWNPPTVVSVRQSSKTEFAITFSEPVYINGSPNIGFAVVKKSDYAMQAQYIDTVSSRYSWSADHKTLYWKGGIAWWDPATAKQAELGDDYAIKFVFVENGGDKSNSAVDNLVSAGGQRMAATTASASANARLYVDITRWEGPYIRQVDRKSDTAYQIHFSEPVNIAAGTRVGMFVIDTTTQKLVNFADSTGYRQIFKTLTAQNNVSSLSFELADNRLAEYEAKASESPNYAVVIGFIDLNDSGQNGAINAITAVSDGEMLVGSGYETTDRVYAVPVDVDRPYIQSAQWVEGATFEVVFSEAVNMDDGVRMGLFVVDRSTGRLVNFGTTQAPEYAQMFNTDRYEWINETTIRWVCGGSYADLAKMAAANANYTVRFGIIDTAAGINGVVDVVWSVTSGVSLAGSAKEASDRAYVDISGINPVESFVGSAVSPDASGIVIDGTVADGEWGDAVIITNPIDAQVRWNGLIAHDPAAVDYNQAVKIYLSNDSKYIYVAATVDHAPADTSDSDLVSEHINFVFSLARYEEETTFARVRSLRKDWERYTAYGLALIDGKPVVRCSNQKIDYLPLDASDYAVRYDEQTGTYHYEIRIPYANTNIDPSRDEQIGFSAMINVGRSEGAAGHNGYHITKGCARRGGAENFAHVDQVVVLSINDTPTNPVNGDTQPMLWMTLCLTMPILGAALILYRKKRVK